jgi:hypothetical protein
MNNIMRVFTVLYFCSPLFLGWHCILLLSNYMSFYKIGINAGANSWGLLFFELPRLLFFNYVMMFIIWNLAKYFKWSRWWMLFLGVLASVTICTTLVRWNIISYADYPTYKVQDLGEFMDYYVYKVLLGSSRN